MKRFVTAIAVLAAAIFAGAVIAQQGDEQIAPQVMESDQFGEYLTDSEGRTLYLFVDPELEGQGPERMTEGVREAAVSCTEDCLAAWPAYTAETGEIEAMGALDPELLYTAEFDGRMHVVYNGWPLFYFVQDQQPGEINGQGIEGFGGEWYVVNPQGQIVRSEDQPTAEGEADGDVAGGGQADDDGEGADDRDDGANDDGGAAGGNGADDRDDSANDDDGAAGDNGADETDGGDSDQY